MYWRAFIREGGSLTPGGGRVQPKPQHYPSTLDGKLACYEGDPVYCNACKSWGVTQCVPPYRPHTDPEGRQANLDGDLCLCKCPNSPRLKALSDHNRMGFDEFEIAGMASVAGWLRYAGHANTPQYDEQVHFSSVVSATTGIPFLIAFEDGRTLSGNLGSDGLLPRIETAAAGSYQVYWGDEALQRMEGGWE